MLVRDNFLRRRMDNALSTKTFQPPAAGGPLKTDSVPTVHSSNVGPIIRILVLAMSVAVTQIFACAQSTAPNPEVATSPPEPQGTAAQSSPDELRSKRPVQTADPSPRLSAPCTTTITVALGQPSTYSQQPDEPSAPAPLGEPVGAAR